MAHRVVASLVIALVSALARSAYATCSCSPSQCPGQFDLHVLDGGSGLGTNIQIPLAWEAVPDALSYTVEENTTCQFGGGGVSHYDLPSSITSFGDTHRSVFDPNHFGFVDGEVPALAAQSQHFYRVVAHLPGAQTRISTCGCAGVSAGPVRGITGDLWADAVLGQENFGENHIYKIAADGVNLPGGVLVDRSRDRLYVVDSNRSRVLGYDHGVCSTLPGVPCFTNAECPDVCGPVYCTNEKVCANNPAQDCTATGTSGCGGGPCVLLPNIVLGQENDFNTGACNEDATGQLFPARSPASQSSLCIKDPTQVSVEETISGSKPTFDANGNLYLPDIYNHRILKFDDPFTTDTIADQVWGQADYAGNLPNRGGSVGPNTLWLVGPRAPHAGVIIDDWGNLWASDPMNARVLRFPKCVTSTGVCNGTAVGTIAPTADLVLGRSSCTEACETPTGTCRTDNRPLGRFAYPLDLAYDSATDKLYVADALYDHVRSRVLEIPLSAAPAQQPNCTEWTSATITKLPIAFRCDTDANFCPANCLDGQGHCSESCLCPIAPPQPIGSDCIRPTELFFDTGRNGLWVQDMDCHYTQFFSMPGAVEVPANTFWLAFSSDGIDADRYGNLIVGDKYAGIERIAAGAVSMTGTNKPRDLIVAPGGRPTADSMANGVGGVAVYGNQLIVADRSRLLIWNNFDPATLTIGGQPLTNGIPADDLYGEADFGSGANYSSVRQTFLYPQVVNGELWVNRFQEFSPKRSDLYVFSDPLSHTPPAPRVIPLTPVGTFTGYPVRGCPGPAYCNCAGTSQGCQNNRIFATPIDNGAPLDFAVTPSGNEVWVADRANSRVFRIVSLDNPAAMQVDVVLGQPTIASVSCNGGGLPQCQGVPPATAQSLCVPYDVSVDAHGNVFIADNGCENGTDQRVLEFDADLFPLGASTAVLAPTATRVFGKGVCNPGGESCFTSAECSVGATCDPAATFISPFKPTFHSSGSMLIGNNPYSSQRFPLVYRNPLESSLAQLVLGDLTSYPRGSHTFDSYGNLFFADSNWSRVLVYKRPLMNLWAYRNAVILDGPEAYWRLGETSTTQPATDESNHSHNGTYLNTGTLTLGVSGISLADPDTALRSAGGLGTPVQVPNSAGLQATGGLTLEMWFKGGTDANQQFFIKNGSYSLGMLSRVPVFSIVVGGVGRTIGGTGSGAPNIGDQAWHHLVGAYDGAAMTLYVDGTLRVSAAQSGSIGTSTSPLDIGAYNGTDNRLVGTIDELALYRYGLSRSQVEAHYDAAAP